MSGWQIPRLAKCLVGKGPVAKYPPYQLHKIEHFALKVRGSDPPVFCLKDISQRGHHAKKECSSINVNLHPSPNPQKRQWNLKMATYFLIALINL